MKKYLILLAGILSLRAFPQIQMEPQTVQKKNYVYFSPVDLFLKTLELSYERNLKNRNAIMITGGFKLDKGNEGINRIGGTGEIQYKVNLLYPEELKNLVMKPYSVFAYFAPFLSYRYEEIAGTDNSNGKAPDKSFIQSGFGGIGFEARLTGLNNRFSLNAYVGGGLKYADINGDKKYNDFWDVGYTGFAPKLSLQMGIAF